MAIASLHRYKETGNFIYVIDGEIVIDSDSEMSYQLKTGELSFDELDHDFWLGEVDSSDNPFEDDGLTECVASAEF